MDWTVKTWEEEDIEFAPKRKINNKLSWKIPHIIGWFFSHKMNKTIGYESLAECLFYFLLELDKLVLRYYVQPIKINIPYINNDGKKCTWIHVSDGRILY